MKFLIRPISASETRPLRQQILRPNQHVEELVYEDDDAGDTLHTGVFLKGQLVGIASVFRQPRTGDKNADAWRVRGMATIQEVRSQGCGSTLLSECIKHVENNDGVEIWCNARVGAVKFYEAHGFKCIGEVFEITGIGEHFVMVKLL